MLKPYWEKIIIREKTDSGGAVQKVVLTAINEYFDEDIADRFSLDDNYDFRVKFTFDNGTFIVHITCIIPTEQTLIIWTIYL